MPAANFATYLFYSCLARPPHERLLYRYVRGYRTTRLVVLGVGDTVRSTRMIKVALRYAEGKTIDYTGIDLFEARGAARAVTLKTAYRRLKATGAKVRLLPGDPLSALARHANSLVGTDLLIISADQYGEDFERIWFYIPRMLHEQSLVLLEERDQRTGYFKFRPLLNQQLHALAQNAERLRRSAA